MIAFDEPGTTRDSIYVDFERDGRRYTLIDTAGVRRRGKVIEAVEKFSVVKTLQAIEDAQRRGAGARRAAGCHRAGRAHRRLHPRAGRALVVGVNKWDGAATRTRATRSSAISNASSASSSSRTSITSRRRRARASASCCASVDAAYAAAMAKLPTPQLTRALQRGRRAPAAAARRHGPPQAALRAPGRHESAARS